MKFGKLQKYIMESTVLVHTSTGCTTGNVKDQMVHATLKLNVKHFAGLNGEAEYNL